MQVSFKGNDPELSSITLISEYSCPKVSQLNIKVAASGKRQTEVEDISRVQYLVEKKRPEQAAQKPGCSFAKRLFGGRSGASVAGALLALFPALMAFLSTFVALFALFGFGVGLGVGLGSAAASLREGQTSREQ